MVSTTIQTVLLSVIERNVKSVVKSGVANAAINPTVAPRTVLGDITVHMEANLPGTAGFIPHRDTVKKAVNRARNAVKGYPAKPRDFGDLKEIPVPFTVTADGSKFLIANTPVIKDNPSPNAPRVIVFMSDQCKEILASCPSWYVDGTFKAADHTIFTQLVFVVGLTRMDQVT